MDQADPRTIDRFVSDVLVIGGGVSGCMAAIAAAEHGAKVRIVDKATLFRGGNAGGGNKDMLAHLGEGEWENDDEIVKWYSSGGLGGLPDLRIIRATYAKKIREVIARLEEYGIEFYKDENGRFVRKAVFGSSYPNLVMFKNGSRIKPLLSKKVRQLGVRSTERTMVTALLKGKRAGNARVIGAVGFNIDTGKFSVFQARAVILAAGESWRLYSNNTTGNAFSTWHSPYNTGSGPALAFEAGADIIDLELCKATMHPKGFGSPGIAAFTGFGGFFLNGRGERYMLKYSSLAERAPRPLIVRSTIREIEEGRGPIYIDCRHFDEDQMKLLRHLLVSDMLSYEYFFDQKKLDLKKDLLEVEVGALLTAGGLRVDEKCATNIEGLYGAGDCALSSDGGLGQAFTVGLVAGESAASYALGRRNEEPLEASEEEIQREYHNCFLLLDRADGISPGELEKKIQSIMNQYVGYHRTEKSLRLALDSLMELRRSLKEMRASNLHELMRAFEARHILSVAVLIANGALYRTESRSFHFRDDFKDTLPEWNLHVVQRKGESMSESGLVSVSTTARN